MFGSLAGWLDARTARLQSHKVRNGTALREALKREGVVAVVELLSFARGLGEKGLTGHCRSSEPALQQANECEANRELSSASRQAMVVVSRQRVSAWV